MTAAHGRALGAPDLEDCGERKEKACAGGPLGAQLLQDDGIGDFRVRYVGANFSLGFLAQGVTAIGFGHGLTNPISVCLQESICIWLLGL